MRNAAFLTHFSLGWLSTAQVLELTGYTGTVQRELAELYSRPTDADDAAADQVSYCMLLPTTQQTRPPPNRVEPEEAETHRVDRSV